MAASTSLLTVNFEVFGKVQGVFFRKNTWKKAMELGVKGWVRNTDRGTVEGTIQGTADNIMPMKYWLKNKGSRSSRIDNCVFKEAQKSESFAAFEIRK